MESDEENLEQMRSILSLNNLRKELTKCVRQVRQVCQGMNWKGCGRVMNLKFSRVCEGRTVEG